MLFHYHIGEFENNSVAKSVEEERTGSECVEEAT
jgi:hypothetical protein